MAKVKPGWLLSLRHHQLRGLIHRVVRPVPVDDDAIDAAADHVRNLALDLRRVGGAVADIHVVRLAEPQQQVSVDLRRRAGIKQRVNVDLADIPRAAIAIRLGRETVGRAGVVGGLSARVVVGTT